SSGPSGLVHAGHLQGPDVRSDSRRDHLLRHPGLENEMITIAVVLAGLALAPQGFRGDGTGRTPAADPPLEWSDSKNVLWSTKIGPNKYSSPIVVGRRI